MKLRRRFSEEARQAGADTELALVSALQESGSPGELLHDELEDDVRGRSFSDPVMQRTAFAAIVLALLTLLVARRRR